jgi:SEC-C motif-containing protein
MNTVELCPCGSELKACDCCARWLSGELAPTAEALMRSRYTAFVNGDESYLLATWHARTRPKSIPFDAKQKWLGLRIVATKSTGVDSAQVEFIARYRIGGGSATRLHERSRFVREGGRWFYMDGDLLE